ncbi:MAG: hypothetical protein HQL88_04880 [Magnetococcales bacterium]|nr:hypothetical protein [Magnetococcales bacterium]
MSHPHQVAPSIVQQNTDGLIVNCAYNTDGLRYLGYAVPGSLDSDRVWQIQRLEYVDGKVVAVRFAGHAEFTQAWNNREALAYS